MNKVTVYEDMWGQGALLTEEGALCCLGFACAQDGVSLDHMVDKGMPSEVCDNPLFVPPFRPSPPAAAEINDASGPAAIDLASCTKFALTAAEINDAVGNYDGMSLDGRKQALTKLFKNNGITLVFEPKAPDDFRNDVKAALERYHEDA